MDRGVINVNKSIAAYYRIFSDLFHGPSYRCCRVTGHYFARNRPAPYYYDRGKVKIKDAFESDQIYINGAFAGTVGKMKSIRLEPVVGRDVYVVTGKTVEIYVNGN